MMQAPEARPGRLFCRPLSAAGVFHLALLGSLTIAGTARADEGEWSARLLAGYSLLQADSRQPSGLTVAVDLCRGLADAWAVRATALTAVQFAEADEKQKLAGGQAVIAGAFLGVSYVVDVVRVVPTIDLGLGVLVSMLPGETAQADLGLDLGLAIDYLVSRRLAIGVAARYHAYLTDIQRIPVFFYVGPRLSLSWR